jgi:uncharacterized membrane protein YeaQ/YmgE (transglycosylase-associated protein family)
MTGHNAGPGQAPSAPATTYRAAPPAPAADPTRLTARLRLILAVVLLARHVLPRAAAARLQRVRAGDGRLGRAGPHRRGFPHQRLAAAIGSAVVTTVYFSQRIQHGAGHAMTVSVAVVGAIVVLCLGLVRLLPRSAPEEQH